MQSTNNGSVEIITKKIDIFWYSRLILEDALKV